VENLPPSNQLLLQHLICVLRHICDNYLVNEMTSHNMAVCVGQCLLWPPSTGQQPRDLQSARKVINLVQRMIDDADEIFGIGCLRLYSTAAIDEALVEPHFVSENDSQSELVFAADNREVACEDVCKESNYDKYADVSCNCSDSALVSCIRNDIDELAGVTPLDKRSAVTTLFDIDNIGILNRDVELRSPHGAFHAADSGFVDDDSSVTEALLSISSYPLTGVGTSECRVLVEDTEHEEHAVDLRQTSRSKRDSWTRSFSDEKQTPELNETYDDVECDNAISDDASNNCLILRHRNRSSVELQCRQCGLRTLRCHPTKARRRLSLPICIRICRCRSGMTANGSDLFPTRIISNNCLLPTVFEDDALLRVGQESSEDTFSRLADELSTSSFVGDLSNPSSHEIDKVVSSSPAVQCQHYDAYSGYIGDLLQASANVHTYSSSHVMRNACRSPPSYAEALLHKALRSGAHTGSETERTVETAVELDRSIFHEGNDYDIKSSDTTAVSSMSCSTSSGSVLTVNVHVSFVQDATCSDVESANNNELIIRRPPPAYEIATRCRLESGNFASDVGKSDLKIAEHVVTLPISNEYKEQNASTVLNGSVILPNAAFIDNGCIRQQQVMPKSDCLISSGIKAPSSTADKQFSSLTIDNTIKPSIYFVKNCDVFFESSATAEKSAIFPNSMVPDKLILPSSLPVLNTCATVTPSSASAVSIRRQARAAKRRSVHSSSDTQIETVFGKSAKSRQVVVSRSSSDCGSVASRRRPSRDNKENPTIDHRLSNACKRLCHDIENVKQLVEHSKAMAPDDPDSNNNCSDKASMYAEQAVNTEISKRQVLKVKNHEWYQKLVKQYSEAAEEETSDYCSDFGPVSILKCDPIIEREEHQKMKRSGCQEQRRLLARSQKSTVTSVPPCALIKQLTDDANNYKERIKVTWSVSKLREKYNVNESTDP